ncbi:histone-like nucleoid-structuring protein Lsr2 [Actinomadura syzygii]|nr:histone-like nucleoid-structuring protein Lsr2 [Actinomadura syzygii]
MNTADGEADMAGEENDFKDAIDGLPADETVLFSLDGASYQIDLHADHAKELRAALDNFIKHAKKG